MKANLRFMLVALCAIVVGVKGNGQMCTSRASRDGILMPSRGSLLSLNTFKQKVVGVIWKRFYFGSSLPKDGIFLNGEFLYSFSPDGTELIIEFSGKLPNGTCIDETSFDAKGLGAKRVFSRKAAFVSDTEVAMFFSSDPDSYLLHAECRNTNRPVRRCPQENMLILLLVKSVDKLPLHRALNDLYRATCLTLDTTLADFRFLFVYAENTCPTKRK